MKESSFTAKNRAFVLEMLGAKKRLEDYLDRVDPHLTVYEPASLPFGGTRVLLSSRGSTMRFARSTTSRRGSSWMWWLRATSYSRRLGSASPGATP